MDWIFHQEAGVGRSIPMTAYSSVRAFATTRLITEPTKPRPCTTTTFLPGCAATNRSIPSLSSWVSSMIYSLPVNGLTDFLIIASCSIGFVSGLQFKNALADSCKRPGGLICCGFYSSCDLLFRHIGFDLAEFIQFPPGIGFTLPGFIGNRQRTPLQDTLHYLIKHFLHQGVAMLRHLKYGIFFF